MDDAPCVSEKVIETKRTDGAEKEKQEDLPLVLFACHICGLKAKCRYGKVQVAGRTHSYKYAEEVYYMMDPFRNRAKPDERRMKAEGQKVKRDEGKGIAPSIFDFFVVGALCAICGQSVCLDELCSVYYSKTFCSTCITREKAHFPEEILQQLEAARNARKRRDAEEMKPPEIAMDPESTG